MRGPGGLHGSCLVLPVIPCPSSLFLPPPSHPPGFPPLPCCSPVGHYCPGGDVKTACSAGSFNPLLGQSASSACKLCSEDVNSALYTSAEGEAECTVPLVDIACVKNAAGVDYTDGMEYDAASQTCVKCQAGTYRPADATSCAAW